MHKGIYVVWDNKAEDTAAPILMLHKAEAVAIREFRDIIADERGKVAAHPEDYDLYYLGELSIEGRPEILSEPRLVVNAQTIVEAMKAQEAAQ